MASFSGEREESTEDLPGRKKSKLKSLKTRLFGRSKRAGGARNAKLSQSESDITAGKGLGSEEDLACSEGMMGSRALSHESIFLADQVLTDAEPARVLSQENVHSKIKTLQMKLQQQKMHLGPPPLVLPIRRPEDPGSRSEDESLTHSPPDISEGDITTHGALSKTISQPPSRPLSPIPKPAPTKSVAPSPSVPLSLSASSNSVVEPSMDFSSPAQFTPCLDTSAARHRMSVKPRNKRASTKKRPAAHDCTSHLHTLNNINHPESVKEEEQWISTQEGVTSETEQGGVVITITPQHLPSKSPEVASITSEATSKSSSLTVSQQDLTLPGKAPSVPSQVLRVKPHRPNAMSSERPHSSFIQSELKDKTEGDFDIQVMSRNTLNKAGMSEVSSHQLATSFGSVVTLRSSSAHQQVQGETERTRGITRPTPGSGSFHLSITTSKTRDGERPRSGSFVGVLEQTETRHRTEDKPFSNMWEREELRDLQPRGGPFAVGRLREEGALNKSPVLPWDMRDSLKRVESVTPSENVTTDSGTVEGGGVERSQEVVEDAVEAQEVEEEEESKAAFGIKLRSTSQATRLRPDASSNQNSKPPVCEEQCDKQKRQEISDTSYMSKKLSRNISCTPSTSADLRLTVKHNLPSTGDPHIITKEVQTTSSTHKEAETALAAPREPQPAPQTAPPEVSWMSLAMEKTRSLQQLFTNRFPRDFTGVQTAARPQTTNPTETLAGTQIQTQTVKIQQSAAPQQAANLPSTDTEQSRSQAQTVKPSLMAVQQKTSTASPIQPNTSREPQTSKQSNELQSLPNTTQPASVQTNARTTQSPSHSSTRTDSSSQFAQRSVTQSLAQSYISLAQQQPPGSNRGLHPANQLKSTTSALASVSTTSSATAAPPVSALGRGEREATMQEKEGASLSGRRAVWPGSVSERAAFLEKRAEWTTQTETKGNAQTEAQISGESAASARQTPLSKDTKPEGRQGVNPAESSPYKVPERPREDKCLRKNVTSSALPSSSPTMPSTLQSISDSGQPSWMELAKRKSMAWSDKSME